MASDEPVRRRAGVRLVVYRSPSAHLVQER